MKIYHSLCALACLWSSCQSTAYGMTELYTLEEALLQCPHPQKGTVLEWDGKGNHTVSPVLPTDIEKIDCTNRSKKIHSSGSLFIWEASKDFEGQGVQLAAEKTMSLGARRNVNITPGLGKVLFSQMLIHSEDGDLHMGDVELEGRELFIKSDAQIYFQHTTCYVSHVFLTNKNFTNIFVAQARNAHTPIILDGNCSLDEDTYEGRLILFGAEKVDTTNKVPTHLKPILAGFKDVKPSQTLRLNQEL